MRSNIIIAGGLLLFGAIVMATLQPADLRQANAQVVEQGIVTEMYETEFRNFVLKLKGQAETYYIDGSLGVSFAELKDKVLHKPVIIEYPQRWSPLKEKEAKHFISKLEYEGEVIYTDNH